MSRGMNVCPGWPETAPCGKTPNKRLLLWTHTGPGVTEMVAYITEGLWPLTACW